jgi:hypothetical protein
MIVFEPTLQILTVKYDDNTTKSTWSTHFELGSSVHHKVYVFANPMAETKFKITLWDILLRIKSSICKLIYFDYSQHMSMLKGMKYKLTYQRLVKWLPTQLISRCPTYPWWLIYRWAVAGPDSYVMLLLIVRSLPLYVMVNDVCM